MGNKIRRKYLIHEIPDDFIQEQEVSVRQGYLCRCNEREIRIRQSEDQYAIIVKTIENQLKEESEVEISAEQFEKLWSKTKGLRIIKNRRKILYRGIKIRVDTYLDNLEGLIIGKVDFESYKEMHDFENPVCFQEELSLDSRFKESQLAALRKGRIQKILPLREPGSYQLIGVLPYLRTPNTIRLMLITTRGSSSWIFPKGQAMKGKSTREVSLIEAHEEAGIKGEITGNPFLIPYLKGTNETSMLVYPMEISKIEKAWNESKQRKRKLCHPHKAITLIEQKGLRSAIGYLDYLKL